MSGENLVPKLRFSGFDDEWEKYFLSDVIESFVNGQTPSRNVDSYWNGDIPWVSSGELNYNHITSTIEQITEEGKKNANLKLIPSGTFLMAITGLEASGTRGSCAILDIDATTNQSCMALFPKKESLTTKFLYYWYLKVGEHYGIKYTQGTKQQSYNKELLEKLPISLPNTIEEQNKITDFLSSLNRKIELLQEKQDYYQNFKKYLMQQIFAQKLRFDFDKEWKKVKLKDIVERVTRKNTNLETDLALTISAEYGLIDQEEFFNKIVASKSLKNYYLIKNGEFAYNKSYSNGYPYGAIKRLDDYPMGALSTLYICFKPTDVSSDYLKEYFETTFWYKEIYSIAVEGARNHGLLNINVNDFFNTKHLIPPSTEEQEKIADLFKSINSKIDAVNNDLNLVKNFKKGLLQQMFV